MNVAYNPYTAVNKIYNLKGQWDTANNSGDDTKKNDIAAQAQQYYAELRKNNYGDIADELQASNYTQAKNINDKWAKMGKTATRDYMYSLGKKYGLSESEVNSLIGWDNQTGEVSFGGKKIGTPDTVIDGVSYWGDTTALDSAFKDYADRSGLVRSKSAAVDQENEKLFERYSKEYDDLKNTNPFTTDEAKAILAKYSLAGLQGRDNAVASGSASNGGNIDSFAAANALRQQSALVNQGQMTVLEAHQQKLDHARALLSDMGVNIDRVFNEDETAKNNAVARDSEISSVSGYVTDDQLKSMSSLWMNGELANTATDYQARINDIKTLYDKATNEADKQSYGLALKLLEMARNDKIAKTGSSEAPTYYYQSLVPNAEKSITQAQLASSEKIMGIQADTEKAVANTNAQAQTNVANIGAASAIDQINTQGAVDAELLALAGNSKVDYTDEYNKLFNSFKPEDTGPRKFIVEHLKPYFENPSNFSQSQLIELITSSSEAYNIDVEDAAEMCKALGVPTDWLVEYVNRTGADQHKGMQKKATPPPNLPTSSWYSQTSQNSTPDPLGILNRFY